MMSTTTQVKERPIIFGPESVRAILEGRKVQTRRVIKPQPDEAANGGLVENRPGLWGEHFHNRNPDDPSSGVVALSGIRCPYVRPCSCGRSGDRLYVKETWRTQGVYPDNGQVHVEYRAGGRESFPVAEWARYWFPEERWRNPRFMPRWASRLLLEITDVRVERLQQISEEDARAEGVDLTGPDTLREWSIGVQDGHKIEFRRLWDSINAKRGYPWKADPWVWVISFKRVA